jgi:hypothetical protein
MKTLRWVACFPAAFVVSLAGWLFTMNLLGRATYGPSMLETVIGLTPHVLHTAIAAVLFVVTGPIISPSVGRRVVFVFFGLSLVSSAGTTAVVEHHKSGSTPFWFAALIGIIVGALFGLLAALRIQRLRAERPNKAPEPTPGSVTPRATERLS